MVKFDELPVEIQEKMLNEQVAQGNPRNATVFRRSIYCGRKHGGFNWCDSDAGHEIWSQSLHEKNSNHDIFFQKYPKHEKTFPRNMLVWNKSEDYARKERIHGYIPTIDYPWISNYARYAHAKEILTKTPSEIEMEALQVKIQELQNQFNKLKSVE